MSSNKQFRARHPRTGDWFRPLVLRIETHRPDGRPDNMTAIYDDDTVRLSETDPSMNQFAVVLGNERTFFRARAPAPTTAPPPEEAPGAPQGAPHGPIVLDAGGIAGAGEGAPPAYMLSVERAAGERMLEMLQITGDPNIGALLQRALCMLDLLYQIRANGLHVCGCSPDKQIQGRVIFWGDIAQPQMASFFLRGDLGEPRDDQGDAGAAPVSG